MFLKEENLPNKNRQRSGLLADKYAPFNNAKLDVWKEVLLFALGNVFVISLISAIVGTILFSMNEVDKAGAKALITYAVLFAILVVVVGLDFKKLLPKFKNWIPYVVGLAVGASILLFDQTYMRLVNLFYSTGTGGNETAIRQVIARYPAASIIIFGIIGPICEELTYRVGMFNLVKRWNRIAAYIVTGVIFGLIHMDFGGNIATEFIILPTYIAPGLLLSFAYDLYDLPCSLTAHITNNLFVIISQVILINS